MASLTSTLDQPTRGKPVIEPAPLGPSWAGGLSELFAGGVSAASENYQRNLQINDRKAQNDLEGGIFKIQQDAQEQSQGAAQDEIINQIDTETFDAKKVQAAVQQGRLPPQAMDAKMESLVSSLMQKYPDQKAIIADRMRANGFSHYLFRDQQYAEAENEAQEQSKIGMQDYYRSFTKNAGLWTPDMTDDQAIATGRQLASASYQLKLAQEQVALEKDKAAANKSNFDVTSSQSSMYGRNWATQTVTAYAGKLKESMTGLIAAAAGDQSKLDDIEKNVYPGMRALITEFGDRLKNQYSSQVGANPDVNTVIDSEIKQQVDGLDALFNGPSSQYTINAQTAKNIENQLGIDSARALPLLSMLSKRLSPVTVATIFNNDLTTTLSKDTMDRIHNDLLRLDPANPGPGMKYINEISALVKGQVQPSEITDLSPDHLRALRASMVGNGSNIITGNADESGKQEFLHSTEAMALATQNIVPGYHNMAGLSWAADAIGNPDNVTALVKMAKDSTYGDRAKEAIQAVRGGAMQILLTAPSVPTDKVPGQKVVWDGKQNRYVVQVTPTQLNAPNQTTPDWMTPNDPQMQGIQSRQSTNKPNPQLQQQANAMTLAVHTLLKTAAYDPEIPKGTTPAQLISHYVFGKVLPQQKNAQASNPQDKFVTLENEVQATVKKGFSDTDLKMPYNTNTPKVNEVMGTIQSWGLPKSAAAGVTGALFQESALKPDANGDGGSAVSLAQWHEDRQKVAAQHGFDLNTTNGALGFIHYEFQNGDPQAQKAWKLLQNKDITPEEAAEVFTKYFERPATDPKTGELMGMADRKKYARQFYGEG